MLCKEIDREDSPKIQSDYREKITGILNGFNTVEFDQRTQELTKEYARIYGLSGLSVKDVFLKFAQKYSNIQILAIQLFQDLKIANEFKIFALY